MDLRVKNDFAESAVKTPANRVGSRVKTSGMKNTSVCRSHRPCVGMNQQAMSC